MKKNGIQFAGKISKLLLLSSITASSLMAHGLWLNSFEAESHGSNIVTIGLGSGHNLTIEDSVSDRVELVSFDLTEPDGKNIPLKKPLRGVKEFYNNEGLQIVDSNLAMQKITLEDTSKKGTYSANFVTKQGIFTEYIDKNDKKQFSIKPKEKIRNLKEIISSIKSTTYAKTYFVNKKWTEPKPIGHELEIIPINDISKLYVGDKIELKVLYKGVLLKDGFVTAKNSLSKTDNALFGSIRDGKVDFVLTNYGQWSFKIDHKKTQEDYIIETKASMTINIK